MAVPDKNELFGVMVYYREKYSKDLNQLVLKYKDRLHNIEQSYAFRQPEDKVFQNMQRLDELSRNIQQTLRYKIQMKNQEILNKKHRLKALGPMEVLRRGYSICYKDGEVVKDIKQVDVLDTVQVKLSRGYFISQIQLLGEGE